MIKANLFSISKLTIPALLIGFVLALGFQSIDQVNASGTPVESAPPLVSADLAPDPVAAPNFTGSLVQPEIGEPEAAETFFTQPTTRYRENRPDERYGRNIHIFYVLAKDTPDRGYDTNGKIFHTVKTAQTWLYNRSNRDKVNFDTAGGQLDITFIRLDKNAAELTTGNYFNKVSNAVTAGANFSPSRYSVVFYDAPIAMNSCLYGNNRTMILNLNSTTNSVCRSSFGNRTFGLWEYGVARSVVSSQSLVDSCAPHFRSPNSVSDDNTDLMSDRLGTRLPSRLDSAHDDYYKAFGSTSSCRDLNTSGILQSFTGVPRQDFYDVPRGAWYENGVSYTANYLMLNSTNKYFWLPSASVSRTSMVYSLWRQCRQPVSLGGISCVRSDILNSAPQSGLTDVPSGSHYEKAVNWAKAAGVIDTCSPTLFCPNGNTHRDVATQWYWRAIGSPTAASVSPTLSDVPTNHSAFQAINYVRARNLMKQRQFLNNAFNPSRDINHAEWADLIAP